MIPEVQTEALECILSLTARHYRALPCSKKGRTLTVAIERGVPEEEVERRRGELSEISGYDVKMARERMTRKEMDEALDMFYELNEEETAADNRKI